MNTPIHKFESYQIIKACFEVHNQLGSEFLEAVYKDALVKEFINLEIPFSREVKYEINYKGEILSHFYFADFLVYDKIILEVKAVKTMKDEFISQAINYLKVSNNKLALLVNFGESSLNHKRILY